MRVDEITVEMINNVMDFYGKTATSFEVQGDCLLIHLDPIDVSFISIVDFNNRCLDAM